MKIRIDDAAWVGLAACVIMALTACDPCAEHADLCAPPTGFGTDGDGGSEGGSEGAAGGDTEGEEPAGTDGGSGETEGAEPAADDEGSEIPSEDPTGGEASTGASDRGDSDGDSDGGDSDGGDSDGGDSDGDTGATEPDPGADGSGLECLTRFDLCIETGQSPFVCGFGLRTCLAGEGVNPVSDVCLSKVSACMVDPLVCPEVIAACSDALGDPCVLGHEWCMSVTGDAAYCDPILPWCDAAAGDAPCEAAHGWCIADGQSAEI